MPPRPLNRLQDAELERIQSDPATAPEMREQATAEVSYRVQARRAITSSIIGEAETQLTAPASRVTLVSVDVPLRELVILCFKLFIAGIPVAIVVWIALLVIAAVTRAL